MNFNRGPKREFPHLDRYNESFRDSDFFLTRTIQTEEDALQYFEKSYFYDNNSDFDYVVSDLNIQAIQEYTQLFFKVRKTMKIKDELNQKEEEKTIAVYYCLDGDIFQCPDLYSLIKYRLVHVCFFLHL